MHGQPDRIEQFRQDIAELRVHEPSAPRDKVVARIGVAVMVAGVALGGYAYLHSNGTSNPLQQRDAIVIALFAVSLSVVGGALYVRAAMAGFLRFWLLRDLHERRAQTDRLLGGTATQEPQGSAQNPNPMDGGV